MDRRSDGALAAMEAELRVNLSVDGILPLLEREAGGFMVKEEKMHVTSVNRENTPEMVTRIVNILRKKGDNEFDIFLDILDKSGNNVWANKLRERVGRSQRVLSKKKPRDPNQLRINDMMPYMGELASLGLQLSGWLDVGTKWTIITKTPGTPEDHVQQLLTEWLIDEEDPYIPHTWTHFIEVVRGCKRGKLAEKMEREVLQKVQVPQPANLTYGHEGQSGPPQPHSFYDLHTRSHHPQYNQHPYAQPLGGYAQPQGGNSQLPGGRNQPIGGISQHPGGYNQQTRGYSQQQPRPLPGEYGGHHLGQHSHHPASYTHQGGMYNPGSQHGMYSQYQSSPGPRNRDPVPLQPTSQHGHDSYVLEQGAQLPRDTEENQDLKSPTQASDHLQNHPSQQSGHHSLVAASQLPRVHQGEFIHLPPPVQHQGGVGGQTHPPQPQQNPAGHQPLNVQHRYQVNVDGPPPISSGNRTVSDPVGGDRYMERYTPMNTPRGGSSERPHSSHSEPTGANPNPLLDSRPKEGSVLRLVGGRMSADWDMFAMYLGFEGNTRRTVEMDNMRQCHKCFMAVITIWMQGKHGTGDLPRTWRSVLQSVRDCGHRGLADDVTVSLSDKDIVCRQPPVVADPVHEITDFLRKNFYQKFMDVVVAKAIAMELHQRGIIAEAVRTRIERALSAREANGHLYDHLCSYATWESLGLFCEVLMSEDNEGYTRMKELGVEMLQKLNEQNRVTSSKSI